MERLIDFKHRIAPFNYQKFDDYMILSDVFMRYYLVLRFPDTFSFMLLNYIASQSDLSKHIEISYLTEMMKSSMSKAITKERQDLVRKADKAKEDTQRANYLKQINEMDDMIWDLTNSGNKTFSVTMVIRVCADSYEELIDACERFKLLMESMGFDIMALRFMQEELFKLTFPLWKETNVKKTLEYNYGLPLTTRSLSGLWPYYYDDLRDDDGFLLGIELYKSGLIRPDFFLWLNDPQKAVPHKINSGNFILWGGIGSGKTTAAYKAIVHFIREGIKLIWIDPENINQSTVHKYGGQYVLFGVPGNIINVLDLRIISTEDEEKIDSIKYDTKLAKNAAVRDLKEVLRAYHSKDVADLDMCLNVLDDIVFKTYDLVGITKPTFETYTYNDYPTLSDVYQVLNEEIKNRQDMNIPNDSILEHYTKLAVYLLPLIKADGQFFDGHTSITFDRDDEQRLMGIGTKLLDAAGEKIRNPIFYLIMRYTENVVFDRSQRSVAVFEEAHRFILLPYCLIIMANMWLRVRKYHSICGLITQEVQPFAIEDMMVEGKPIKTYTDSIVNNSVYKLVMGLDKTAIRSLEKIVDLSEDEATSILRYTQGQGLFIRANDRYPIYVYPHKNELADLELNR